jgi:hypothetical protein
MRPGHRRALAFSALRIALILAVLAGLAPGVLGTLAAGAATAQVAVVGSSLSESPDGRSSVSLGRPVGTQPGHVLVAAVAVTGNPAAVVTPAGWNRLRDDRAENAVGQAVFVRVVSASDPATYDFDLSGKTQAAAGLTAYSGVETASPVEAQGVLVNNGVSVTAPSLPVSTAGGRLLNLTAARSDGAVTPPAGMAEQFEANSPHPKNDKDVLVALADEPVTTGGATGTRTSTLTRAGRALGVAVVLRPAGSLPPPPPPDTTAPETTIDSGPSGTVDTGSATFTFSANEAVRTFRCRLDNAAFADCTSPKTYSGLTNGTYTFEVAAVDVAGNTDQTAASRTWTVQLPVSGDTVLVGAGDIASCSNDNDEATAQLVDGVVAEHPQARVFTIGDNVYDDGTTSEFNNCYDPTWGRHKARTRPTIGNHEYGTAGAAGYFGYFGGAAGPAGQGYYDYMEGGWHVVVLNSECSMVGGCHAGSAQEQWLRARLADVAAECTVAMWHRPRFSSGSVHGSDPATAALWQALYDDGAELVLTGHDHIYERFAPQDPTGLLDNTYGIRQITAGLGGRSRYGLTNAAPNSLVRYTADYGVLKLTLRNGNYDFEMLRAGDAAVVDSGTASCHGAPAPPPPPPPPVPGTIGHVGSSISQSSTARGSISLARPAGVGAGHVMVAQIVSNDDDPGFVAPPGWTLVSDRSVTNAIRQAVYHRVATSSDPTSYTWNLDVSTTRRLAGGLTAYSGVDTANPVDAANATVQPTATTVLAAPSLTASVAGTQLLHLAAVNAEGTITPPQGMNERWEAASPNGSSTRDALAALADMGLASAGGTGVRTATASQAGPNVSMALLLRPAPG